MVIGLLFPRLNKLSMSKKSKFTMGDAVVYTSDGCSYGVVQCQTVHQAYEAENR